MSDESKAGKPESRVCRTCSRVLHRYTDPNGTEEWIHTLQDSPAHDPDPVMPDEIDPRYRCDFCNVDDPSFVLPVRSFPSAHVGGMILGSMGDWLACDACAALIEKNQWSALRRRMETSWEQRHGEALSAPMLTALSAQHRQIRKNITGALRPLPKKPEEGSNDES